MSTRWTIQQIKDLKKEGKIRDYKILNPEPATPEGRKVAKHFIRIHPQKNWMAENLLAWCQEKGIILQEELWFAKPERRFRFDWAVEGCGLKIGIEYEGISSEKSRHTTISGYTGDTEKYNMAQALGWEVLRFTALNYKDLITELNKHYESTKKPRG